MVQSFIWGDVVSLLAMSCVVFGPGPEAAVTQKQEASVCKSPVCNTDVGNSLGACSEATSRPHITMHISLKGIMALSSLLPSKSYAECLQLASGQGIDGERILGNVVTGFITV